MMSDPDCVARGPLAIGTLTKVIVCVLACAFLGQQPLQARVDVFPTSDLIGTMTRMSVDGRPVLMVPTGSLSGSALLLVWYEEGAWLSEAIETRETGRAAFFAERDSDRLLHLDSMIFPNRHTLRFMRVKRDPWRVEEDALAEVPSGANGIRGLSADRDVALITVTDGVFQEAFFVRPEVDPVMIEFWPSSFLQPIRWSDQTMTGVSLRTVFQFNDLTGRISQEVDGEAIGYPRCFNPETFTHDLESHSINQLDHGAEDWKTFAPLESFGKHAVPQCFKKSGDGKILVFQLALSTGFDVLVGYDLEGNQKFSWPARGFPIEAVSHDGRYVALHAREKNRPKMSVLDTASGDSALAFEQPGQVEFVSTADGKTFLIQANAWNREVIVQGLGSHGLRRSEGLSEVHGPNPYAQWAMANLIDRSDFDHDELPEGDGDDDGLMNALEFALGGSLSENDSRLLSPIQVIERDGSSVRIQFERRANPPSEIAYEIEWSPDINPDSWKLVEGISERIEPNGTVERVDYEMNFPDERAEIFLRLKVRISPDTHWSR